MLPEIGRTLQDLLHVQSPGKIRRNIMDRSPKEHNMLNKSNEQVLKATYVDKYWIDLLRILIPIIQYKV